MTILVRISVLVVLALVIGGGGLYVDHASAGVETFVVTKEADTNDGSCDPSDCSVREAFVAANQASTSGAGGGAIVQIPAGTYLLQIAGGDEDLGATGDFDVLGDLTVTGAGPASTKLDGADLDRLVDVREGGSLDISGLTIQHGKVGPGAVAGLRADGPLIMSNVHVVNNKGEGTNDDGSTGGVTLRNKALITDSVISDNVATGASSGGLFATDASDVTVRNTLIERNSATGDFPSGGGVLQGTALLENVTVKDNTASGKEPLAGLFIGRLAVVTIHNSRFLNNDATGNLGVGGIFNRGLLTVWDTIIDGNDTGTGGVGGIISIENDDSTSKVTLRRVTISNNTAGGGVASGGAAFDTLASLSEVTIDHNSAQDGATGGLKFFASNPTVLDRVSITNNSATTDAVGGLRIVGGSNVSVFGSTIDHNTAGDGSTGGVHVAGGSTAAIFRTAITNNTLSGTGVAGIDVFEATATLQNVTISGNSAVGNATGGAFVQDGTLTLSFVTIANNTAGSVLGVGGLTNYGTLSVSNSILGANAGEDNCFQTAGSSAGHNIDIGSTCGFNTATDMSNTDPNLGGLANNGGYTMTHAITGLPAVDAGDCGTVVLDQRVVPRPQGSACDIGAFEFGTVETTAREWGDLLCDGVGPEDALALIAGTVGVTTASPAGAGCPGVGDDIYVAGWFLHRPWGDFNCNGVVEILDALAILQGVVEIGYPSLAACPKVGDEVQVGQVVVG